MLSGCSEIPNNHSRGWLHTNSALPNFSGKHVVTRGDYIRRLLPKSVEQYFYAYYAMISLYILCSSSPGKTSTSLPPLHLQPSANPLRTKYN